MRNTTLDLLAIALLVGFPMLLAAVASIGLLVYTPVLYMLPGLCIGLLAWARLLADVLRNGLL